MEQSNHNNDTLRLSAEGREVKVTNGYIIVHHVPYVNTSKEVCYGKFAVQIQQAQNGMIPDHTALFCGSQPCDCRGVAIDMLIDQNANVNIDNNVYNLKFSRKPQTGYKSNYDQLIMYLRILSEQAERIDPSATSITNKSIEYIDDDALMYYDYNACKANITTISDKLRNQKICIIGLGGTGSYLLDFISKTPVKEIHIIDGDKFYQNNAFRAPGAASYDEFTAPNFKVDRYNQIYSQIHKNIYTYPIYIDENTISMLDSMDFVFISIDNGIARKKITQYLSDKGISFIDTGMNVDIVRDSLRGAIRTSFVTREHPDELQNIPTDDFPDNVYSSNIQIAELNALNAILAVIKWKRHYQFYVNSDIELQIVYNIDYDQITNTRA